MSRTATRSAASERTGRAAARGQRLLWLDVARSLALLSMFVAHAAPTMGPFGVLMLTEYVTAPLFAALVGASALFESRRVGWGRALAAATVRAAFLVGAAWVNSLFGAQVLDVLQHLAVITVVAALLAAAPTVLLAVIALVLAVCSVLLSTAGAAPVMSWLSPRAAELGLDPVTVSRQLNHWVLGDYRLLALLAVGLLGMILARLLAPGGAGAPRGLAAGIAAIGLVASGGTILLTRMQTGSFPVAYAGDLPEFVTSTALVVLVFGLCAAVVPGRRSVLTDVLTVPGSMTLTLYMAHQAYLGWVVNLAGPGPWRHPSGTDDSWFNLAVLCVGAIVFALAWRTLVKADPWRRGPVEGLMRLVTRPIHGR